MRVSAEHPTAGPVDQTTAVVPSMGLAYSGQAIVHKKTTNNPNQTTVSAKKSLMANRTHSINTNKPDIIKEVQRQSQKSPKNYLIPRLPLRILTIVAVKDGRVRKRTCFVTPENGECDEYETIDVLLAAPCPPSTAFKEPASMDWFASTPAWLVVPCMGE